MMQSQGNEVIQECPKNGIEGAKRKTQAAEIANATWLKPPLAKPLPLGSFDVIALADPLVHVDSDCDPIPGMSSVVQVIAVLEVHDIHLIVFVPVVRPVFRPRVHKTEPKTAVLEAGISAIHLHGIPVHAEPVIRTEVPTVTVLWNTIAVVPAPLLPGAVLGLPATCAMLLPDAPMFASLSMLLLLWRPSGLLLALLLPLPLLLAPGPLLLFPPPLMLALILLLLFRLSLLLMFRRPRLLFMLLLICERGSKSSEKQEQNS
ncbi:MAG: hypothetical protein LAN71_03995 [Acidobacteriia bacterium]|nr:hypothetical protein [Terriglobia bacterium]